MKVRKLIVSLVLFLGVAVAITAGIVGEWVPESVRWGTVDTAPGEWSLQENGPEYRADLTAVLPDKVLLLRSHWPEYTIYVDDTPVYASKTEKNGAIHLFELPEGETLRICFLCENPNAEAAIMRSGITLGSKSSIYRMLIRQNLYAALFAVVAFVLGGLSISFGLRMRSGSLGKGDMLISLGMYVLCAGAWVLTDSKILLLVTQKTGVVELLSFLSFYALPLPLLRFTSHVLPERERMSRVLQRLFEGMLLLFLINYTGNFSFVTVLIVAEHLLMATTIGLMVCNGFRALRQRQDGVLRRVLWGYLVFAVFSVAALGCYYTRHTMGYSVSYVLGICGFVFFLADGAWMEIYAQIQENANVAVYARMAYQDRMTGMGNRAAFMEEMQRAAAFRGPIGYIMMDLNNLKRVNDTLGHQQGDALIIQASKCIWRAAAESGKCYRIGGDEFVVSLMGTKEEQVRSCVDRIREEVRLADQICELPISVSLGYAWRAGPEETPESVLKQADDAMYAEKRASKLAR